MVAILATRYLRHDLGIGLLSGRRTGGALGNSPPKSAQLNRGLQTDEMPVLNAQDGRLLAKTTLSFCGLREAAVQERGNRPAPVGGRSMVTVVSVPMLKRDAESYLSAAGGFAPMLPSPVTGDYAVVSLLESAG
jgi:hypothetical protein